MLLNKWAYTLKGLPAPEDFVERVLNLEVITRFVHGYKARDRMSPGLLTSLP